MTLEAGTNLNHFVISINSLVFPLNSKRSFTKCLLWKYRKGLTSPKNEYGGMFNKKYRALKLGPCGNTFGTKYDILKR